jgi:hypothetical protein
MGSQRWVSDMQRHHASHPCSGPVDSGATVGDNIAVDNIVPLFAPRQDSVAKLILAASGAAEPGELLGESEIRAAFRAAVLDRPLSVRRRFRWAPAAIAASSVAGLVAGTAGLSAAAVIPPAANHVVVQVLRHVGIDVTPKVSLGAMSGASTVPVGGSPSTPHGAGPSSPSGSASSTSSSASSARASERKAQRLRHVPVCQGSMASPASGSHVASQISRTDENPTVEATLSADDQPCTVSAPTQGTTSGAGSGSNGSGTGTGTGTGRGQGTGTGGGTGTNKGGNGGGAKGNGGGGGTGTNKGGNGGGGRGHGGGNGGGKAGGKGGNQGGGKGGNQGGGKGGNQGGGHHGNKGRGGGTATVTPTPGGITPSVSSANG